MIGALFKLLVKLFNSILFAAGVLVASHLVEWQGVSLSEHVRKSVRMVKEWAQPARQLAKDARAQADELGSAARRLEKISAEERARLEKVLQQ